MQRFILRRLFFFLLTLLLTSIIIFALMRILPGDVARVILGKDATQSQLEDKREELGLNDPYVVQYFSWLVSFVQDDWGESYAFRGQDIKALVKQRGINSARLALVALLIAIPISITLGVIAGLTEGKLSDSLISILSLSVVSLPEFVTGLFLIKTVALKWKDNPIAEFTDWWFPSSTAVAADASFREALPSLWLPAIAATLVLLAYLIRLTRASVIEELKKDYVRTAVLKGIPYRVVIFKHVLRNALLPTVTVIAISMGWLVSGLVVIESVFNYQGLGSLLITAIKRRDLPLVQAIVMVTVIVILISNFLADLLYAILNPRIELS